MDSNKLGFKLVRINQGYTDLLEINGEHSWTKSVWDVRNALANIENLLDSSSSVLMLAGLENGNVLTIAAYIAGRPSDCISAWIYVPATISISGKELVELVESIKKEILASAVNGVINDVKLHQLFSKSYEPAPATKITGKSEGDKFACRYYGQGAKHTLSELLKDMTQSYYKNYKCLFLLDNAANLKLRLGDDLTAQKVYSTILLTAPDSVDGFVPHVNGQLFKGQVYAVEGDVVKIEWRRGGYETITTDTLIRQDFKYTLPSPDKYVRIIPYNMVQVVDERNNPLNEYELYVENKMIRKGEPIHLNEACVANASIKVYAGGYNVCSKKVNLNIPQRLVLIKVTYTYEFMLPLKKNAGDYSIVIEGQKPLDDSPVEGYVLEDNRITTGKNYLIFKPYRNAFWRNCIIAAVVVLLLGCSAGYFLPRLIWKETISSNEYSKLQDENKKLKKNNKALQEKNEKLDKENQSFKLRDAISYLDSHAEWSREAMEEIEMLKGLFDALNDWEFDKINSYEGLKSSKTMKKIFDVINDIPANKDENAKPFTEKNKININDIKGAKGTNGYLNTLKEIVNTLKEKGEKQS